MGSTVNYEILKLWALTAPVSF